MSNEVRKKSLSNITAQASAAITADAFSAGTQTTINQAGASGNAEGAFDADLFGDVTVAPSGGDATFEVWMEASEDNTNFAAAEYCCSVKVSNGYTGRVHPGIVELLKYSKLKIKAVAYGFTASLIAVPQLPEVQ